MVGQFRTTCARLSRFGEHKLNNCGASVNGISRWRARRPPSQEPAGVIETLREKGVSGATFPAPYDLVAQTLVKTLAWEDVPQPIQDACITKYGVRGYVEIVVLTGFYQMFAAINQGFAVPLPEGARDPFESHD